MIHQFHRAQLHDVISMRPGGYDGHLEEGGANLSVGQRQRLTFARMLYRNTPIWLLDEPSSALDPELERSMIRECVEHAERGGLVIVASHHESWIRKADRVWKLHDGVLDERRGRWESAQLN